MSEKQNLYAEIIKQVIYICRNELSVLQGRSWRILPWAIQRQIRAMFDLIQFIHGVAVFAEDPKFSDADFQFVDDYAQAFFAKKSRSLAKAQYGMAPPISALIEAMPEEYKAKLTWSGPKV